MRILFEYVFRLLAGMMKPVAAGFVEFERRKAVDRVMLSPVFFVTGTGDGGSLFHKQEYVFPFGRKYPALFADRQKSLTQ
jgi:hypothetical protein